jgi:hypothetical protein
VFGKLLTNQKIAHKIVKPYVYKALREGLKLMTTVKYKISEGSIPSLSDAERHESYALLASVYPGEQIHRSVGLV